MRVKSSRTREGLCNRLDILYIAVYVVYGNFVNDKICFKTCFMSFYWSNWNLLKNLCNIKLRFCLIFSR